MGKFKSEFRSKYALRFFIIGVLICIVYVPLYKLSDQDVESGNFWKRILNENAKQRKKQKEVVLKECQVQRYNSSIPLSPYGCQRLIPVSGSCQLVDKLFFSSPVETCKHQQKYNICEITDPCSDFVIKCSDRICVNNKVTLGEIDPDTGNLQWQNFSSIQDLERQLNTMFFAKKIDHYGFCFIRCAIGVNDLMERKGNVVFTNSSKESKKYINIVDMAQQLFIVPPNVNKNKQSSAHININILLLDSVSHSHFLRSMPKTLHTLRELHGTSVLNFELFQSLKGQTYHNLQALFSGELYDVENPFEINDILPNPVNLKKLLSGFKKQKYETMYTEDLCWIWKWGLVKNLLAYMPEYDMKTRWKFFKTSLKNAGIDRIDLSLASCEILQDNHKYDPFFGPPAICYNGQYQHHYILKYLSMRQMSLEVNYQPFFHNTLLNVAHDDTGRRIQTLDGDLANYVKTLSELNNTFTIILSDHGNAYGEYIKRSEEARVEMFHPVLFMIVPPGVAKTLGEKRMNALKVNQQRLVSILDIHYALRSLGEEKLEKIDEKHQKYSIKANGIFSEIASNRSCNSIPRIEPNICICEGYEYTADNNASFAVMAEFALGSINNAIQQQFLKSNPDSLRGFGSCQRLVAHHFGNIKQRHSQNGDQDVKMNLYIPHPDNSSLMEIFMVILKVSRKDSGNMRLVIYERITRYTPFEKCADRGVLIKLCVCSLTQNEYQVNQTDIPNFSQYSGIFDSKTLIKAVDKQCLNIFERKNNAGVVLEARNICVNKKYAIKINITTVNMTLSSPSPVEAELWPGMMSFLVAIVQTSIDWDYKYTVKYTLI